METVKEYFPKEKTQLVGQILGEVFYKERKVNKCSELSNLLLIGGSQ